MFGQKMQRCRICRREARHDGLCGLHYGHEKGKRGRDAEIRLHGLVTSAVSQFAWVRCVRFATRVEDHNHGIDVVVETDIGDLWLQCKYGKPKKWWRKKWENGWIDVIVVNPRKSDSEIIAEATAFLLEQRGHRMHGQGGVEAPFQVDSRIRRSPQRRVTAPRGAGCRSSSIDSCPRGSP